MLYYNHDEGRKAPHRKKEAETMKLQKGYALVWGERSDDRGCGSGTTVKVELTRDGKTVATFTTCPCGRGCGGKDVVVDDWGYHDTEPQIEAVRLD